VEDVTTEADALGASAAAAGGTAGMVSSSGDALAAGTTTPTASESPVDQRPAAIAPVSMPSGTGASVGTADDAPALAACTYSEGTYGRNCDSLYVTMKQVSPPRCVQLTFDNCGEYGRRGLAVDVPMPWRLDSGTVSSDPDECELGVFYPTSSVALSASGSVTWNQTTRLPSELALDVTLETSTPAGNASIDVTTTTPLTPVVCPD